MKEDKKFSKLVIPEKKTPLERIGENIEVLSTRFNKVEQLVENLANSIEKSERVIANIVNDLDDPKREHGRTPTRTMAYEALKKAQHETRLDDLAEHGVIKGIQEDLNKQDTKFENSLLSVKRRLNAIPAPDTMESLLKSSFEFGQSTEKIANLNEENTDRRNELNSLNKTTNEFKETYNGNDHPTGPEFDEVLADLETMRINHNDFVHFLKGVFTSMKIDSVAKCIEDYKRESKKESDSDGGE